MTLFHHPGAARSGGEEESGLHAFFARHPEEAHRQFFERSPGTSRRGFFAVAGGLLGMAIPFYADMPQRLVPIAFAGTDVLVGKDGLTLLNERPVNAETPAHLLDDAVTPTARHFVRNNGSPPGDVDADGWTLAIDGLVRRPATMTIADLRSAFEVVTMALTIECAGNGRASFSPRVPGTQWTDGAVACSQWTGVRLADVIAKAEPGHGAVYTAHYGADAPETGEVPFSRGLPIAKAMTKNVLIAFAMNGGPLHRHNGAPLRLVVPGWPGSCSQKWLNRIKILDRVHDSPMMTGTSYRIPRHPVAPGDTVPEGDFRIVERMPVKSLVTFPRTGAAVGREVEIRGHAWSGDRVVEAVDLTFDFGASWVGADVDRPANAGAWQNWRCALSLPEAGYYEVWSRARDEAGGMQPFATAWNPRGYLNNAMHRIALYAA